jgi:uncharacterized membrane protein
MTKKPKYTRKDDYLLMLAVSLALMFQVVYDMLHELYFRDINLGWFGIQGSIIIIFVVFAIVTLRKMQSFTHPF